MSEKLSKPLLIAFLKSFFLFFAVLTPLLTPIKNCKHNLYDIFITLQKLNKVL
jgi:hypothetical protein